MVHLKLLSTHMDPKLSVMNLWTELYIKTEVKITISK